MELIPGKLYRVRPSMHDYDDELIYFTDPFCVYNYCLVPGDGFITEKHIRFWSNYEYAFMYIGICRYDSLHNTDVYYFKQFLYGTQTIYFRYISEYMLV